MVITIDDDSLLGGLVSFGLGGVATDLLEDRAFRSVPITDLDAAALMRAVRASPLLFGYRVAEDLPELAHLKLNPIVVSTNGLSVLDAKVRIAQPHARPDLAPPTPLTPVPTWFRCQSRTNGCYAISGVEEEPRRD